MGKKAKKEKKGKWWMVAAALVVIAAFAPTSEDEESGSREMPTPEPTVEATFTPAPTSTPIPTEEPTETSAPTPKPTKTPKPTATPKPTNTPKPTATSTPTPTPTLEDYISGIVDAYNSLEAEQLVFDEDFTPSDKNSGHYRTEFRLTSFRDAIGKSYRLGEHCVDIVSYKTLFGKVNIRVYASGITLDQVLTMVQRMSLLMDDTLSNSEIEDAIAKIKKDKEANGYYYGNLGMVLLGDDEKGYNLMIKKE